MNPSPKHRVKSLPLAVLPSGQVVPCSLPQFPLRKGPAVPYVGKPTQLCGWQRAGPLGGGVYGRVSPARGGLRTAQQPGEPFCSDLDLKNQMSRNELKGCPCPGAHPSAPTLPKPAWLVATGWFSGSGRLGWVRAGRQVPQQDPNTPARFPSLHRAGEGESERKREGKDMSNQSYLNKSLFGPRALLKAAYLIKSPIFHIYGPYSVKY